MIYGYARVSTKSQSIARQIENIKKYNSDAVILAEAFTGTKIERPKFKNLLKVVTAGDTIIFDEVSRMSRNAAEGFGVYQELFDRGVNLEFIKEPHINSETYKKALSNSIQLNTGSAVDYILEGVNKFLKEIAKEQIKLAFKKAQQEVDFLHQRTAEGMLQAKLEGKQIGQRRGNTFETSKAKECKSIIVKHSKTFNGSLNDAELLKMLGISRNSFYKYKREIKDVV